MNESLTLHYVQVKFTKTIFTNVALHLSIGSINSYIH